jgi:hypothetical protein
MELIWSVMRVLGCWWAVVAGRLAGLSRGFKIPHCGGRVHLYTRSVLLYTKKVYIRAFMQSFMGRREIKLRWDRGEMLPGCTRCTDRCTSEKKSPSTNTSTRVRLCTLCTLLIFKMVIEDTCERVVYEHALYRQKYLRFVIPYNICFVHPP